MPPPRLDLAIRRSHDLRNALHTAILISGSARPRTGSRGSCL